MATYQVCLNDQFIDFEIVEGDDHKEVASEFYIDNYNNGEFITVYVKSEDEEVHEYTICSSIIVCSQNKYIDDKPVYIIRDNNGNWKGEVAIENLNADMLAGLAADMSHGYTLHYMRYDEYVALKKGFENE